MKLALSALAAALIAAAPAVADEFTGEEKAAIDRQIRAYILEHPEIIVEAMDVLESRQKQAREAADRHLVAQLREDLVNDGFSFAAGNPEGDVTVIEFADYRCGYCKQAHDGVRALLDADPNVRLVIKEFPILGPDSTLAARAAMAAIAQGGERYMKFNDLMMRHRGELKRDEIIRLARKAGLDSDKIEADMENPAIAKNIQKTYGLARRLDIQGTPAFIVGDRIVRGFLPYDGLRELVEDARGEG
jgi:protein-disulfide isomerase